MHDILMVLLCILHYFIIFCSIFFNILFIKIAIIPRYFSNYTRFLLFSMSSLGTITAITFGLGLFECLTHGTYFETLPVFASPRRQLWNKIGQVAGFIVESSQSLTFFERLICVKFPKFYASRLFKLVFVLLLVFTYSFSFVYISLLRTENLKIRNLAVVAIVTLMFCSLLMIVALNFYTKRLYYNTTGCISLNRRFQISNTYELCRGLFPASLYRVFLRLIIIFVAYQNVTNFEVDVIKMLHYFFYLNIFRSSASLLFPILFMTFHRKLRRRLVKLLFGQKRLRFRRLDVAQHWSIEKRQNEYFESLKEQWRVLKN